MLKKMVGIVCAVVLLAGGVTGLAPAASSPAASSAEQEPVPLKTWYREPAQNWEQQAMPIGNGFIGGMVFGGVDADRIQTNEQSVWSGGPGADPGYNGGHSKSYTSQQVRTALQEVRQLLQDQMTEFSQNHKAYVDQNGKVVSSNYPPETPEIRDRIVRLFGDKSRFGSYQTLSNIMIFDADKAVPFLLDATSSAEPDDSSGEVAANLFDNIPDTKWFSGNTAQREHISWPVTVTWRYNGLFETAAYHITSANDVPDRDPAEWKLYGSTDGQQYTLIDHQTGVVFTSRHQKKFFELSQKVAYSHYKLEIIQTAGGRTPPQLADIELVNAKVDGSSPYTDYVRELDLRKAVVTVSYQLEGVHYTRNYFVSNPDKVMVIRLTADTPGSITRRFAITTGHSKKTITAEGDTITLIGQPADQRADGLTFAQQVKVIPKGGSMAVNGADIEVTGADEVLVLMSAATNYQQCMDDTFDYFKDGHPLEDVKATIEAAAAKSYEQLLEAHIADYSALFSRVEFNLGVDRMPEHKSTDQLLQGYKHGTNIAAENRYLEMLYYQFGRYLLIASSREGSLPANLQGIWADGFSPTWNCDYHTNINLQMNYWLAQQTNLAECHLPVIDYVKSLVPRGRLTAKYNYCTPEGEDVRGWVIHHENNIWGNTAPGSDYTSIFPAAAAWMCQDLWEYYAFTQDKAFLEENFDILLEAALFWVDNLWTDTRDGTLVTNPAYSPEHGPVSLGTSADQAIIWELFEEVKKAAAILGKQDMPEVQEVATAQSKLHMPKIGLAGQYMEWKDEITLDITGDNGHRHVNHLHALHPGTYVVAGRSEQDDKAVEAMKVTLNTRGDGGTGWSKAWKINLWARLRDGDRAGRLVTLILKESTYQNLLDVHPPFQIDGNFGATAGMTEMLLQSQGDSIDLLPALPGMWPRGSVQGIKARGNFEVSMVWDNQRLQSAEITSGAGRDCVLGYQDIDSFKVIRKSDGKEITVTRLDNGRISFPTEQGETYLLVAEQTTVLGDVNGDGNITTTDARLVLQRAVGKIEDDKLNVAAADVNGDGRITATDARLILQKAVGKILQFPIES